MILTFFYKPGKFLNDALCYLYGVQNIPGNTFIYILKNYAWLDFRVVPLMPLTKEIS